MGGTAAERECGRQLGARDLQHFKAHTPSPGEAGPITVCGELEGTFGEGSKPANGRMPCSEKGHGSEC